MHGGKVLKIFTAVLLLVIAYTTQTRVAQAGSLTELSVAISDKKPVTSATHTISFKIGTDSTIKQINFQYQKTAGDTARPAHLDLSNATLGTYTGLTASSWSINTSSAADGLLKVISNDGDTKTAGDVISIDLGSIINPEIGECSTTGKMYDNCYMGITTYSDFGTTWVDTAATTYYIEAEASLEFTISSVNSGVITNGVTTNVTTTHDSIAFGNISPGQPVYAAQKLMAKTSAANGYVVNMKLDGYLQGLYPSNKIDPFAAVDAAWASPQAWSSPTGTVANSDTGWIGANTSDTRVVNWQSAAGKFGPVSSTKHAVMYSSGKDAGTNIYVTYAIEVSAIQPTDQYAGTILYEITTTY